LTYHTAVSLAAAFSVASKAMSAEVFATPLKLTLVPPVLDPVATVRRAVAGAVHVALPAGAE